MTAIARIFALLALLTLVACSAFVRQSHEWPVNIENTEVIFIDPPAYAQSEFECMQLNVYHEAGNQDKRGMEAVALVTLRRTQVKSFKPTVCGVVKQGSLKTGKVTRNNCQFSWYCDGKGDKPNLKHPLEAKAWAKAGEVAERAMLGQIPDFTAGATHYHATYVLPDFAKPEWRWRYKRELAVGIHVFYKDVKLGLRA